MQVKVKRRGDDAKFLAKVLAVGVECDIALLSVESSEFWEGIQPLRFGSLPRLQASTSGGCRPDAALCPPSQAGPLSAIHPVIRPFMRWCRTRCM